MVAYIYLFSQLLLCALAFYIGNAIAQKSKKIWQPAAIACVLIFLLLQWLKTRPDITFQIFPSAWIYFHKTIAIPFVIALFAISLHNINPKNKRAIKLLIIVVIIQAIFHLRWIFLPTIECQQPKTIDGVCLQSTGSTCGAASLVTLLHHYNVSVTEQQMADKCAILENTGTNFLNVAHVLNSELQSVNGRASLAKISFEQLQKLQQPAIVEVRYNFLFNHLLVVFRINDDTVEVGDPLKGRVIWPQDYFRSQWLGFALFRK